MPLPSFIIFGAIKSGTGALYQYLSHHPEIYMSAIKEPRFFTDSKNYEKRAGNGSYQVNIEAYKEHFKGVRKEIAIGEASSNYIYSSEAATVIKQVLPEVKLIATLRNPVDRAYAHYRMMNGKGGELDIPRIMESRKERWIDAGMYHEKLKPYYDKFKEEKIKILILEEWDKDIDKTLRDVYIFLGVNYEYKLSDDVRYSAGEVVWSGIRRDSWIKKVKPYIPREIISKINTIKGRVTPKIKPISKEVRKTMMRLYREDIERLQCLINKDLSLWLKES